MSLRRIPSLIRRCGARNGIVGSPLPIGPPPQTDLTLNLNAREGVVSSSGVLTDWEDQSTRGHTFSSVLEGPVVLSNGWGARRPGLRFNNPQGTFTQSVGSSLGLLPSAGPMSVYVAIDQAANVNPSGVGAMLGASADIVAYDVEDAVLTAYLIGHVGYTSQPNGNRPLGPYLLGRQYLTWTGGSGTMEAYRNDVLLGSAPWTDRSMIPPLEIGGFVGEWEFRGVLAHVLAYSGKHTALQRAEVHAYLAEEWPL